MPAGRRVGRCCWCGAGRTSLGSTHEGPARARRQRHDQRRRPGAPGGPDRRRRRSRWRRSPTCSQHDVEVVITHGNGPQVGNLLVKNELAAAVVPPVPLDWCGAQTQAHARLRPDERARRRRSRRRGVDRRCADRRHPHPRRRRRPRLHHARPSRSAGSCRPSEAAVLVEHGETWEDRGEKGWRRVVASPEPLEILDAPAVHALVEAGFVVVANGGGGIPVVARRDGVLRGVEAVIDKDLGAALLARDRRRRRARHRHRRPQRRAAATARPRPSRSASVTVARAAGVRRRGPLRQRLDGPEGRRRLPLRRARRAAAPSSPASTTSPTPSPATPAPSSYRRSPTTATQREEPHARAPSRSARSRSTPSPTPPSSPSSSTTA